VTDLDLMNQLANIAVAAIKEKIPIKRWGRLRKGIKKIVTRNRVTIFSIYYWTRFVNDGRGPIRAKEGGPPLIFFRDPRKDPRINKGYPKRPGEVQKLTKRSFNYHKRQGNLIITRNVGPATGLKFLEHGLQVSRKRVPEAVRDRILKDVRASLTRRRDSITVNL